MRLGDLDALSAFVGDLRSTLHKEQTTFKAMTQSEFEIKDSMLLNFQYAIDNAPTVEIPVESVSGTWKYKKYSYYCSNCGNGALEWEEYPYLSAYCPFCGAAMRGKEE